MSKKQKSSYERNIEAKIITLGDSRVGKTSLIVRFIEGTFAESYMSTVGFDLKFKSIKLKNGQVLKLMIHDTAGQERFKSLAANYIKKADGILLVYDITDNYSFNNIGNWMLDINNKSEENVPVILIGNKSDLNDQRKISYEDGLKFAEKNEIHFYETSCENGENVEKSFMDLAEQIYKLIENKKTHDEKNQSLSNKKKQKNCC